MGCCYSNGVNRVLQQKKIAEVIVNHPTRNVDKIFHYGIKEHQRSQIKVGTRILVPFGFGNKKTEAFVINLIERSDVDKLKNISDVVDELPLFDEKMVALIKWMRHRYLCTYYEAIKAIVPPGIGLKFEEWIVLNQQLDENIVEKHIRNSAVQQEIISLLKKHGIALKLQDVSTLLNRTNIRKSINALMSKNIISISHKSNRTTKDKTVRVAFLNIQESDTAEHIEKMAKKAPVQAKMLEILLQNEFVASSDLVMFSNGTYGALNALVDKGLVVYKEQVVTREISHLKKIEQTRAYQPTTEQKNVIQLIIDHAKSKVASVIMLHGVTGSGKTEVFLQVIEQVIASGEQAVVLVPEISLTPQMVERFVGRFGERVAVFHSGLSMGERYDQWKKIRDKEVDVVVGARSAIFAPFKKIGIIIIDEEHEYSYKSELAPRYHAREVAIWRANSENAVVVLSSATPSVESYYKAKKGEYVLVQMTKRYNALSLPAVNVVDMREELAQGNKSIFSVALKKEIANNLERKEQTILFLNRRGFSTFVSCRSCGLVINCPHCNISLTYHRDSQLLTCHYCGYKKREVKVCPTCKSPYIRYFGIGTQKVEHEMNQIFPQASVLRMDVDTTAKKFAHEKILATFKDQHIDILIGTQMVSKGLDFPSVTLIGVLAADMSLNIDDYRAAERTFQLLTQVSGRAGRGTRAGRAIVQTYQPDHHTIQLAKRHDYLTFYHQEIKIREQLGYPPFCQMIAVFASGEQEKAVVHSIQTFVQKLTEKLAVAEDQGLCESILGPMAAPIARIKNKHRWRVLLKCADKDKIKHILKELLDEHYRDRQNAGVHLTIDINPMNLC